MDTLLLLLLDSRSPAGGHHHSGGMEAAVGAGFVRDLGGVEQFCRGRLRTSGRVAAAFAAAACQAWLGPVAGAGAAGRPATGPSWTQAAQWQALDVEFSARTPSEAMRHASRQLGSGLRRLLRSMLPAHDLVTPWAGCGGPAPHHPLVLGAGVALAGGDATLAARAAGLGLCTSSASAAVRLLGLDPYAVQQMLARVAPDIDALALHSVGFAAGAPQSLPAHGAPGLDLLADAHATGEVRLFAS
ncbi:MAG: urease accessory protein UreF [Pseudonocardiales bacterium]|nr:MAG: urease accessory protein UreF [Pseudonocardiales bacterium]